MGLFLDGTWESDLVCVFPGSRLTFDIREITQNAKDDGTQSESIGPAYVHGMIDGIPLSQDVVLEDIQLA
jgi:hypothetical protein